MPDPFSITASILGIVASITSLSINFHQFQRTSTEATSEIGLINDSLLGFANLLKDIKNACDSGDIPNSLQVNLSGLLEQIKAIVTEMEGHVETALSKNWSRGPHWVFSGKDQCRQLQQRLDSYKSTLNTTLTLASLVKQSLHGHTLAEILSGGRLVQEKADQILSAINDIRRHTHIMPASGNDGFILERYLDELESVYEVSTVAGDLWDAETIRGGVTTPRPEHHLEAGDKTTPIVWESSYKEDSKVWRPRIQG
ncbi:hypothetical protein TWF696_008084 [Orbilia brochopaga]|uniref:Fungal N-terminal domain-containing protein n=1 Tax=Orbilia brochopaga TaxID=3140254 RepID=A0AAV9UQU4_9PEZI